ncbi:MAG TPA: hypothetical protein VGH81_06870 [Rudaea sp.]|jgi:hypothetical protein
MDDAPESFDTPRRTCPGGEIGDIAAGKRPAPRWHALPACARMHAGFIALC